MRETDIDFKFLSLSCNVEKVYRKKYISMREKETKTSDNSFFSNSRPIN